MVGSKRKKRKLILLLLLWRRICADDARKNSKRPWKRIIFEERAQKGEYHTLVRETMLFDHEYFFMMFRMTPAKFEDLLAKVGPSLIRDNRRGDAISSSERLCVTLRYLVTGDSFVTISGSYRMSATTVGRIVKDTSKVIWDVLCAEGFLKVPQMSTEWLSIAKDFEKKWHFNNCIGAIDGKHVSIQCPPRGGSLYFNYKKIHSLVLLAVVNAKYEFTMVDIGDYGRMSDGSVFASSNLGHAIGHQLLDFPAPRIFPGTSIQFPYVFVGDDAFPVRTSLLKPYPRGLINEREKIFNYRLSRARRIVENVFGIVTSRFRVFRRSIIAREETAVEVIKAIVALHNYLMHDRAGASQSGYCPNDFIDQELQGQVMPGHWRNEAHDGLHEVSNLGSNNYTREARQARNSYRDFFCSDAGKVPWQWDLVRSTSDPFDEQNS